MKPVVAFDLDDTLAPERVFAESGLRTVGQHLERKHGLKGAAEELLALQSSGNRGLLFDEYFKTHGGCAELIPELVKMYREHSPKMSFYADVRKTLQRLAQDCHLAVITDGPTKTQRNKVVALGLEQLVEFVVITDEHGRECWKPHPHAYRLVMNRFSAQPSNCWYVGDNAHKDFVAPNALGWNTIEITRRDRFHPRRPPPTDDHRAGYEVCSLTEVVSLLLG